MALFLTGGGEQEDFAQLDNHFLNTLGSNAKLLLIPLACEEGEYDGAYERIEGCFDHKNVSQIDMSLTPHLMSWEELNEYHALIIEGGNTFKLIQALRETAFFNLMKKFYQVGKHIYADSAGAIILGSDVQTAFLGEDADEDELKLQDYRGLDLISPWAIHAHSTPDEYEDLQDLLYDKGNPILLLSEPTGICLQESQITVFGKEPLEAITFSGKKQIPVGNSIHVDELLT